MTRRSKQSSEESLSANETDGNVDKIREILFGGQMRSYEARLEKLEKKILAQLEQTSGGLESRLKKLETYARREVEKLSEQLKTERKSRTDDNRKARKELDDFGGQVESWFAEVEEQFEAESREQQSALKAQAVELSAMVQDMYDQLVSSIEGESRDLAANKVGREDLASLLGELASALRKDAKG